MADYSIWVLEYCWVPQAPKGLLTHGAFNGGTVKLPWCYVLIKGRAASRLSMSGTITKTTAP
jgi:N-acyl homoserine lactone hydrolase